VGNLSDDEIYQEVSNIVAPFQLLECYECATAIVQWLKVNHIKGKIIRIKRKYRDDDFILSHRLMSQGVTDTITINAKHYGVEVLGKVFDNISSQGMAFRDWINDFDCLSGEFNIQEREF
jgi:hypothetical protein